MGTTADHRPECRPVASRSRRHSAGSRVPRDRSHCSSLAGLNVWITGGRSSRSARRHPCVISLSAAYDIAGCGGRPADAAPIRARKAPAPASVSRIPIQVFWPSVSAPCSTMHCAVRAALTRLAGAGFHASRRVIDWSRVMFHCRHMQTHLNRCTFFLTRNDRPQEAQEKVGLQEVPTSWPYPHHAQNRPTQRPTRDSLTERAPMHHRTDCGRALGAAIRIW